MRKWMWLVIVVAILSLALAACTEDDGDKNDSADNASDGGAPTQESGDVAAETPAGDDGGSAVQLGGGGDLLSVGGEEDCEDEDSEECPAAIPTLLLKETATADGISLPYLGALFTAQTGEDAPEGVLIALVPNDTYAYDETSGITGTFKLYVSDAESVAEAIQNINIGPKAEERAAKVWEDDPLQRQFVARRDMSTDPAVTVALGAAQLEDGRVIALEMEGTGKFAWDLFQDVFPAMLEGLAVADD